MPSFNREYGSLAMVVTTPTAAVPYYPAPTGTGKVTTAGVNTNRSSGKRWALEAILLTTTSASGRQIDIYSHPATVGATPTIQYSIPIAANTPVGTLIPLGGMGGYGTSEPDISGNDGNWATAQPVGTDINYIVFFRQVKA
jgi:hypothetical protein